MIKNYQKFFKDIFGEAAFGRSRKREIVLIRKLIIIFLIKEKGFKVCQVAKIMELHHSVIFHHIKPVIDIEFDRFYAPRSRSLLEKFDEAFPNHEIKK
jgi:hypothetical protein